MSTSETWTEYAISSVDYWNNPLVLSTKSLSTLTDAEAFAVASDIATALGIPLGSEVAINKTVFTQVDYVTDYTTGTFS